MQRQCLLSQTVTLRSAAINCQCAAICWAVAALAQHLVIDIFQYTAGKQAQAPRRRVVCKRQVPRQCTCCLRLVEPLCFALRCRCLLLPSVADTIAAGDRSHLCIPCCMQQHPALSLSTPAAHHHSPVPAWRKREVFWVDVPCLQVIRQHRIVLIDGAVDHQGPQLVPVHARPAPVVSTRLLQQQKDRKGRSRM